MRWWKILGLAGFAGVAATGVVIARAERRRRAYTPEEIRSRLMDRLAEASAAPVEGAAKPAPTHPATPLGRIGRRVRRALDTRPAPAEGLGRWIRARFPRHSERSETAGRRRN
jgi:hypothetical protein